MIDLVLVLVFVGYVVGGLRQGFVTSALSLLGFLGGGALGMWLLPVAFGGWIGDSTSTNLRGSLVLVGGVLVAAAVGQGIGGAVGARLRGLVALSSLRWLDAALGGVASLVAISLLTWFVAGAVRGAGGPVSRAVGQSHVISVLDDVVPPQTNQLFAGFRGLLDRGGFPKVFESFGPERILPVDPPDTTVTAGKGITKAAASIVKVTGVARSCSRSQEGTGWVVAPGKVVTNAHVVAGERTQRIRIGGVGPSYTGRVVLFDPKRDIAVISVAGLPAKALPLGQPVSRGVSTVVAGFPLDGPYRLGAARVRQVLNATGNDIYGHPGSSRQIYSVYAKVRPGNSGGPLLSTTGKVVGVVFASSLDDSNTGYALTLSEISAALSQAASASTPVSTGGCAAG